MFFFGRRARATVGNEREGGKSDVGEPFVVLLRGTAGDGRFDVGHGNGERCYVM